MIGAGPAGLACAATAAARGHAVTLFEAAAEVGGQFRLAMRIPGKEEFAETLRYYQHQLQLHSVEVRLGCSPTPADLAEFAEIVISTGVKPRNIELPGAAGANVALYPEVLTGRKTVGRRVAIIGAGGIGFDVAAYLLPQRPASASVATFMAEWGVDMAYGGEGGLGEVHLEPPARRIYLLQRKKTKPGAGLGKTTGWIHRSHLKKNGVKMLNGVEYLAISAAGCSFAMTARSSCSRSTMWWSAPASFPNSAWPGNSMVWASPTTSSAAPKGRGARCQTGHRRRDGGRRPAVAGGYHRSPGAAAAVSG